MRTIEQNTFSMKDHFYEVVKASQSLIDALKDADLQSYGIIPNLDKKPQSREHQNFSWVLTDNRHHVSEFLHIITKFSNVSPNINRDDLLYLQKNADRDLKELESSIKSLDPVPLSIVFGAIKLRSSSPSKLGLNYQIYQFCAKSGPS